MWALVEDNAITKIINNPKAMVIGDTQYSRNIFSFRWSNEEREAIGLYEVVFDNTNKKDQEYYTNTNQSFAYADGAVTASFGSATAKALADVTENAIVIPGLKSQKKENIKQQASSLLTPSDWQVVKATEVESYSVPSAITTYRAAVRTSSNDMEVLIDACSTVDELATLFLYVNTADEGDPKVMERPLGEFPEAV
jgi:hypothetical protein